MPRTNLATRPFYNERAVLWALGLAAVAIAALTIFNVTQIVSLSREQGRLSSGISADESRARTLTTQAARVRATIDQAQLERVITAAREANAVIDERTFSWTELFNQIERTLPPGVMLTAVTPLVEPKTGVTVAMSVLGREVENVDTFIEKLEATGKFTHVLAQTESLTDEGLFQVVLRGSYLPTGHAPASSDTPEGAAPEGATTAGTGPAGTGPAGAAPEGTASEGAPAATPAPAPGKTPAPARPPASTGPRKAAAAEVLP